MSREALMRDEEEEDESFHRFFDGWITEQKQHLQELIAASKQQEDRSMLGGLVERVINHYEHYYKFKSRCGKKDVVSMFNPSWRSSLEDAFMWIGGWRPSMAFHLLYSKSSLQLEARFEELMQGVNTGDLGDLSPNQLHKVNELQIRTLRKEREITEKLAKQQETVADPSMVGLTHAVTLDRLTNHEDGDGDEDDDESRVDAVLAPKKEGFVEMLQRADDLRLETLKKVLHVLTPMQATHFLIAAAALHLRLHEWGQKHDN